MGWTGEVEGSVIDTIYRAWQPGEIPSKRLSYFVWANVFIPFCDHSLVFVLIYSFDLTDFCFACLGQHV